MNKKNATLAFYDCDCDWLPRPLERHFGKANRSERERESEGERKVETGSTQQGQGTQLRLRLPSLFRNAAGKGSEGSAEGGEGGGLVTPTVQQHFNLAAFDSGAAA